MIYQIVTSDLFNISNRLKSIDKNYFVLFNAKRKKFEVHYKRPSNTYELTVPFDVLDARTVQLVQKTRVQNNQKIFDEIERSNKNRSEYES